VFSSPIIPEYWHLKNYLIYIPVVYLLASFEKSKTLWWFWGLLFTVSLLTNEFHPLFNRTGFYSRFSVVFGSIFLFTAIRMINFKKHHPVILWAGQRCFCFFALHKYFQLVGIIIVSFVVRNNQSVSSEFVKDISVFMFTVPCTLLSGALLHRVRPLRKLFI
jgi:hypothetical protein